MVKVTKLRLKTSEVILLLFEKRLHEDFWNGIIDLLKTIWDQLSKKASQSLRCRLKINLNLRFIKQNDILEVIQIQLMKMTKFEIFNLQLREQKLKEKGSLSLKSTHRYLISHVTLNKVNQCCLWMMGFTLGLLISITATPKVHCRYI